MTVRRLLLRLAMSRPGAWFFSYLLHHLDCLVLRLSGGRATLSGPLSGLPVATLTATGAKSGRPRSVPLVAIPDGERMVLVATNWGSERHPAWYYNLRAHPEAALTVGGETRPYVAREVSGEAYTRYWRRATAVYPGYAAYKRRRPARHMPIMVLTPLPKMGEDA